MNILSVGHLSMILQRSPTQIQQTLEAEGIEPKLRMNGLPYYPESIVERLREALEKPKT